MWATFYGGNGNIYMTGPNTYSNSIGVDATGDIFITGYTNCPTLPTNNPGGGAYFLGALTPGNANSNAFIAKLTSDGKNDPWATYYGGQGTEYGNHLSVDITNNFVYIVGGGAGASTPLFIEAGAYNNTGTGFIFKTTTNGAPLWATGIGSGTSLNGCIVDASGNLYVTGESYSSSYPLTAYGKAFVGGPSFSDAVATGFNAANAIGWSTFYGGDGNDVGNAITVDASGNAYITGRTISPTTISNIPIETYTVVGAYNQTTNGNGTCLGGLCSF
jgi:hypothetical protein